jgi:type II secretory pathway component GspD/PulD (secretin)
MSSAKQNTNREIDTTHLNPYKFKPGQSGNPSGRPKGSVSIRTEVRKLLQEAAKEGSADTVAVALAKRLIHQAFDGDMKAMQMVIEHIDGKPQQSIDLNATIAEVQILDDIADSD